MITVKMEPQTIIRDDTFGQYLDLDAEHTQTVKILLVPQMGGYSVSQTDLANMDGYIRRSWSPFTSLVKLEPLHPKSNANMEIYEERNECVVLPNTRILRNYICVCVGSVIAGYMAHLLETRDYTSL